MNNIPASDILVSDMNVQQLVEIIAYLFGFCLGIVVVSLAFLYLIYQVISLIRSFILSHRKSLYNYDDLYNN